MPHADPHRRRQIASRAANISWARTSRRYERMAPAWKARQERYLRQVDPDGVMDPEEREKAAENARRAEYQEMARKSAEKRAANARAKRAQSGAA